MLLLLILVGGVWAAASDRKWTTDEGIEIEIIKKIPGEQLPIGFVYLNHTCRTPTSVIQADDLTTSERFVREVHNIDRYRFVDQY